MSKFIIAEIGSNHAGTLNSCCNAIAYAAQTRADAVKFQLILETDLYGPHKIMAHPGSIKPDWLPQLAEKAKACGIEFMCSAFSVEGYKMIDFYVQRHKLASPENNHIEILKLLNTFRKEVIFSCGATHPNDIKRSLEYLSSVPVSLLYCVSSYPCPEVRLEKINALKALFKNHKVGFSDHTRDYTCAPVEAFRNYGAEILEKHFNPFEMESPDACVSIGRDEFCEMVRRIKNPVSYDYLPEKKEKEALLKYKRRLIAMSPIKKGAFIRPDQVGVYRSYNDDDKAASPFALQQVLTVPSVKDFNIGDPITLVD